jgi:hypothetical protein
MKTYLTILSVVFVVSISACGQKTEPSSDKSSSLGKEIPLKEQTAIQPVSKELAPTVQESVPVAVKTVKEKTATVNPAVTPQAAPVVKETTEQFLHETVAHAQEITKTQTSKSRQRGQNAEDEMMTEIENRK